MWYYGITRLKLCWGKHIYTYHTDSNFSKKYIKKWCVLCGVQWKTRHKTMTNTCNDSRVRRPFIMKKYCLSHTQCPRNNVGVWWLFEGLSFYGTRPVTPMIEIRWTISLVAFSLHPQSFRNLILSTTSFCRRLGLGKKPCFRIGGFPFQMGGTHCWVWSFPFAWPLSIGHVLSLKWDLSIGSWNMEDELFWGRK